MTSSGDQSEDERDVPDEALPDDLNPEENPLAEGLEPGETAGDLGPGELLEDGKEFDSSDPDTSDPDDSDSDGSDADAADG